MTDQKAALAALDRLGEQLKQPAQAQQEQPAAELHEMLAEQLAANASKWLTWDDNTGGWADVA